jgi:mRNA-degrading endonuclease RelE of RelBE toxin-antitoxin system
MSLAPPFKITFTAAARRRLDKLPLEVAAALYEHLSGPVATNPLRLGKPLDAPLDGVMSTRRGEYRAFYKVDHDDRIVMVLAVAHRRDAYRS